MLSTKTDNKVSVFVRYFLLVVEISYIISDSRLSNVGGCQTRPCCCNSNPQAVCDAFDTPAIKGQSSLSHGKKPIFKVAGCYFDEERAIRNVPLLGTRKQQGYVMIFWPI